MPAPFSVLALDLHNTIYDEAMEYGLAIEEAIIAWQTTAQNAGQPIDRAMLHVELAAAHRALGSDWDDEVWHHLPSLKKLDLKDNAFLKGVAEAEAKRRDKSKELILSGRYAGMPETLRQLKAQGVPIYIITEAAADVGMQAVDWLGLGGIVEGVYSYPSRKAPIALFNTTHKVFPHHPSQGHYRKPHPYLLANVILDETIRRGQIPETLLLDDVFTLTHEKDFVLAELPADASVQEDVSARLKLRDTAHAKALKETMQSMLFVGDSKFKDGLLARNAGVAFGHAAYGKKVPVGEEENQRKSLEIMYAVTGWDAEVLKLTQEAGRSNTVNTLKPDYVFENSLSEALPLF